MPEHPLAGRGIAITRPAEQAHTLSTLIQARGGQPIAYPLLAIAPLDDYRAFDSELDRLAEADWAIFISSNAVEQAMPRLLQRYPALPGRLRFAAIGPTTAARLGSFGIPQVLIPQHQHDSEHLLALPEMQEVAGRTVLLFRGVGGRELLADTLVARGAQVHFAECYRRTNPQRDAGQLAALWQNGALDAVVVTSSEALRNLIQLAGQAPWLESVLLCVNHARIADQARQHGFRVALAEGPDDHAMLLCLIRHLEKHSTDSSRT